MRGAFRGDVVCEGPGRTDMAREADGVAERGGDLVGGAGAASGTPTHVTRGQRWLARLAFTAALAAVVVVLLSGVLKSITALLVGFAGLAIGCAAAWWFLAHRGAGRRDRGVCRRRAAVGDRAQRRARGSGCGHGARGT